MEATMSARNEVLEEWEPVWISFFATVEPRLKCTSKEEAKALRMMYYKAVRYCMANEEMWNKYGTAIQKRKVLVVGTDIVFRKKFKPDLTGLRGAE
jgi:hypothetical protein